MKKVTILIISFVVCCVFVGCASTAELEKAQALQGDLVEKLHDNHKAIEKESLNLYEKQATEDIEFIYSLVSEEDPAKASEIKLKKLAVIEENVKKIEAKIEENEKNYKQFKELQEALR